MSLPGREALLRAATEEYLSTLDENNPPPPEEIESALMQLSREKIENQNKLLPKGSKYPQIYNLQPDQVFMIVNKFYHCKHVLFTEQFISSESCLFTIYHTDGKFEGQYTDDKSYLRRIIHSYNRGLSEREVDEIICRLKDEAPVVKRTLDQDLIPVKNGIFNYKTKKLMPFSPDYVFVFKLPVNYVDNPVNPVIHNDEDGTDWDVESWMKELSDDPEIVNLNWEIIGASVRPNVNWNKSAWFYSKAGNNGKGTLCQLMRNLLGPAATSISIAEFSKEFYLEPLIYSSAIITDENDVGKCIDRVGNLKAVVTGDVIRINSKNKPIVSFRFRGFMVQCLNEMPRIKDKSDSFYRRQLFVPFNKSFTGSERKYIKSDYLGRQEVLEYVLHRVLHMNYYSLSNPKACQEVLQCYKSYNDTVRQFAEEILPQCRWKLLPYTLLYPMFKAWSRENCPSDDLPSRNRFIAKLNGVLVSDGSIWKPTNRQVRPKNYMDGPEPLIAKYNLTEWMSKTYHGTDINQICVPELTVSYRGIIWDDVADASEAA